MTTIGFAFLLRGHVQGVKMRRYVESAARHWGLGGYVINDVDGSVVGEAFSLPTIENDDDSSRIDAFHTWIRGEWEPKEFTNIKPTPVGTAYPALAGVELVCTDRRVDMPAKLLEQYSQFTMIRDDKRAEAIAIEREHVHSRLRDALTGGKHSDSIQVFGSWPKSAGN